MATSLPLIPAEEKAPLLLHFTYEKETVINSLRVVMLLLTTKDNIGLYALIKEYGAICTISLKSPCWI